ncbi:MAG: hypothetical protein Unbinned1643contig1000_37 [Prokaryotic dsDNA virus sp.]|nr:MAG: hypothetical protein Unbinned1643contig1000_37 [Prokaryotic dsDNA virus sp.]|tara:strand:- start:2361 stop:2513 length:153 start_codon:yes stop_codon:yes gene_type:complete
MLIRIIKFFKDAIQEISDRAEMKHLREDKRKKETKELKQAYKRETKDLKL